MVGCWCGCLSGHGGADLHTAQLMPLPLTVSCFSKIHIGFTFLVPAQLGSPGKKAVKRVCVCDYTNRNNLTHSEQNKIHRNNNYYYANVLLTDTACIVCGMGYVMVCCLSVCQSQLSTTAAACGGFAACGPSGQDIDCCTASSNSAAAARWSAVRTSSQSINQYSFITG